jgi:hypothetical protein
MAKNGDLYEGEYKVKLHSTCKLLRYFIVRLFLRCCHTAGWQAARCRPVHIQQRRQGLNTQPDIQAAATAPFSLDADLGNARVKLPTYELSSPNDFVLRHTLSSAESCLFVAVRRAMEGGKEKRPGMPLTLWKTVIFPFHPNLHRIAKTGKGNQPIRVAQGHLLEPGLQLRDAIAGAHDDKATRHAPATIRKGCSIKKWMK